MLTGTIIYIVGPPGVGKYAIGRLLAERLGCRLVDNHFRLNVIFSLVEQMGSRFTPEEGTIMTKSLLTGIAICTALAGFAGNANAYTAHALKTHKTTTTSTKPPLWVPVPDRSRVNTGPYGNDPIYESCEYPWRHLEVGCPYGR